MNEEKEYLYPTYSYNRLILKGLFASEWIIIVAVAFTSIVFFQFTGILFSCFFCPAFYMIMKKDSMNRINLASQIAHTFKFCSESKFLSAEPRQEKIEEKEEIEMKNSKKKLRKQKWKKSKRKNIQGFFPFKAIDDGMIQMENGDVLLFLKVNANNLDLLSKADLISIHTTLAKDMDRNKYQPMFFIQDAVFSLDKNIKIFQNLKSVTPIPFIRKMCEEYQSYLEGKKEDTSKKAFFLRVRITKQQLERNVNPIAVKNKLIANFTDSLSLSEPTRKELKQMLAIYANRIFSEELPDTEVAFEAEEEELLLKKKKRSYEYEQLPGIYNFKDLIVPATSTYNSKQFLMGRNIHKTYAVKCFLGTTKQMNLLAEISSLKGITTAIYTEELSTRLYKQSLRNDLKAKKSEAMDELDEIDMEVEKRASKGSYKRLKDTKQNMYYISVYFQLNAKTEKEMSNLEDVFFQAIDEMDITLDPLNSYQKEAYLTVSPLGDNYLGKWTKQNVSSESLANLYPFNEPALLDPTGLYLGTVYNKKDVVMFDPFIQRGNKNILVLGSSGIGKTVLVMKLLENEIYQGTYIRNIDVEGTYNKFFKKLGGIVIDVSGNNDFCINPLQIRTPDEIKEGIVSDYISEVRNWIAIYKPSWNEEYLDLFERYLTRVYRDKGFTNELTNLDNFKNTDYPLLSDVYECIKAELDKNEKEKFLSESMRDALEKIMLGLESAAGQGADAKLFNRYTYLGDINDIQAINFDMKDLMQGSLNRKLAQWSNVFSFISQAVNGNMDQSKRIMVSIDELHEFLKKEYLTLVDIINSYERRFRKYMSSFLKATQTMDEVDSQDPILAPKVKPLLSQSTYKFLFHLGDIDYDIPKKLLNLKDTEVKKLKEKREGACLLRVNNAIYDIDVDMPEWYKTVKADA